MIYSHYVKTRPRLLPIFRSAEQAAILAELFVMSGEPLSLSELARRTGVSPAGVHKEIERLEAAGLVRSRRVGRTRLVEPDEHSPLVEDLRNLLTKVFGPAERLRRHLGTIPGIERAFIFGSWASPRHDEPPRDVDVMVIGRPEIDRVHQAARLLEDELGRPVDIIVLDPDEWAAGSSAFLEQVRRSPKIEVL